MKRITLYLLACSALLLALPSAAQTFEYTQNKGQWNSEVLYQGELHNGAFFLKRNGYRVVQHHPQDFDHVKATMTGHSHQHGSAAGKATETRLRSATSVVGEGGGAGTGKPGPDMPVVLRSHAYDVLFANANPKTSSTGLKPLNGISNYFIGNDPSKWASGVLSYAEVLTQDMYNGVAVRYYSENGFLKYDLQVQPQAAVEQIVLQYVGHEKLSLKNGELLVQTSVGVVKEREPYAFQLINGQRKVVTCRYELVGNDKVRFRLSGYDRNHTLIIDPTLVFSSFTGSPANNWGYSATYDLAGNLYAGGIALAPGYPVTPGAFQTVFRSGPAGGERAGFDIAIMKFNSNGTRREYATYLGGSSNEQPHSLVTDRAGNLYIAGRTLSSDYPATSRLGTLGQWDIVVSKLNATGSSLLGSVLIGGSGDDGVNIKHKYSGAGPLPISLQQNYGDDARSEVILDAGGNVLVASCSRSSDFPVNATAFQRTLRGEQDALLLKFDGNLANLNFASFLGGGADDAAYVLAMSPSGNIYVGGGTASTDFPGDKTGTVGATYFGGAADGFLAELDPAGTTLVKSAYVGTSGLDQIYGVQFDASGNLYCMGTSTGNFPVRNAPFSQNGGKQFIGKVTGDLSTFVYSTVFGTNAVAPNISPTAFLVDRCENVYVSGWGGRVFNTDPQFPTATTQGLTVTPDAIQSRTDGSDFYFFVMEKDATRQLFGSFFGQLETGPLRSADHVDGGTSRFDPAGTIYQGVCANCGGGQFPTTPGVVGPSNPSGSCNQAVIKIALDLSGVRGGVKSNIDNVEGDTSDCTPTTVVFRDTIGLAPRYEWDFGDGTTLVTNTPNATHTYVPVGTYRVRLIAVDSTKCFPRDTSFVTIRIREDVAPVAAAATKLPPCESNTYRFDNLSTAFPGKPFRNNSFTWIFGDNTPAVVTGPGAVTHQFPGAGTYDVRLVLTDTNYCNAPDTFRLPLRVSPLVDARFETPPFGCAPYDLVINNTSLGGQQFRWTFSDGTSSTATNPVKRFDVPGTYTIKLIAIDSSTCNIIDSTEQSIIVSGSPVADFTFGPVPPQENQPIVFTNQSEVVPRYRWYFGDGDSLYTFRRDTIVRHTYNQTGTYNACLVAINQFGCPDTICRPVPALILPLVDVDCIWLWHYKTHVQNI
ncbi:MAG: PKD domain-containing protein [Chitinophagaceae bacterium]|nr:PKD domain-containing protein [Chitinophagaceae bacterium]